MIETVLTILISVALTAVVMLITNPPKSRPRIPLLPHKPHVADRGVMVGLTHEQLRVTANAIRLLGTLGDSYLSREEGDNLLAMHDHYLQSLTLIEKSEGA